MNGFTNCKRSKVLPWCKMPAGPTLQDSCMKASPLETDRKSLLQEVAFGHSICPAGQVQADNLPTHGEGVPQHVLVGLRRETSTEKWQVCQAHSASMLSPPPFTTTVSSSSLSLPFPPPLPFSEACLTRSGLPMYKKLSYVSALVFHLAPCFTSPEMEFTNMLRNASSITPHGKEQSGRTKILDTANFRQQNLPST